MYVIVPKEVKEFATEVLDTYYTSWYKDLRQKVDEEGSGIFFNAVMLHYKLLD